MSVLTPAGSESSISGLLTCMTCGVGFRDADLQRDHYKSDWHRYNLKRKIVSLPPVSVDNFEARLAAQEAAAAEGKQDSSRYCSTCKKAFGNDKAFQSHIISKKHSNMVKELSRKEVLGDGGSEGGVVVPGSDVTKSGGVGVTLSSSPGKSQAITLAGKKVASPQLPTKFVGSKGQKLGGGAVEMEIDSDDDDSWEEIEGCPIPPTSCLFCPMELGSVEVNLEHMSVHHSFFVPDLEYCTNVEGLLDYLGSKVGEGMMCLWCNEKGKAFYDVQAVQQHMRDKGHCKMLHDTDAAFEYSDYYDFSSSYPEGSAETTADELYTPEQLAFNENMQLVLPSGVTLGHRALKLYYRQYVRPGSRSLAEVKTAKRNKILSQYKAIGYGGTALVVAQQKLRDQRYFKHVKDKYSVKLGVTGNKTLQTYFRRQVQF